MRKAALHLSAAWHESWPQKMKCISTYALAGLECSVELVHDRIRAHGHYQALPSATSDLTMPLEAYLQ